MREVYVKLWHKKRTESSLLSKIITSLTPVSILGDSSVRIYNLCVARLQYKEYVFQ